MQLLRTSRVVSAPVTVSVSNSVLHDEAAHQHLYGGNCVLGDALDVFQSAHKRTLNSAVLNAMMKEFVDNNGCADALNLYDAHCALNNE